MKRQVQSSGQPPGHKEGQRAQGLKGSVRIIGGQWRGRRVPVADITGLRPSGDRCRETLFNWLQPLLPGAHCVDLFAGTGVLGFEAVSRGATRAVLVEKARIAASALRQSARSLDGARLEVVEGDALSWLVQQTPASMDIVFVDPPFAMNLAEEVMKTLAQNRVLRPGGCVYLESPAPKAAPLAGPGWELVKEKRVGDVRMQLYRTLASIRANNPADIPADIGEEVPASVLAP